MLLKKVISIFLMILIIGSMNIEIKADVSNVIINIGLNALAKQSTEIYTLTLCIINQEACAGSIFNQALSKVSPELAKTWNTIENPVGTLTSTVLQEVAKEDPKAAQTLQNVLQIQGYLKDLFPDAKIEADEKSTDIIVEKDGKIIRIRQPPSDSKVIYGEEELEVTTTNTDYVVNPYFVIGRESQGKLTLGKEGETEFYLTKTGTFKFGGYTFKDVQSNGNQPSISFRLDEDEKVIPESIIFNFKTTTAVNNLEIPGVGIDTKENSRIYYNLGTNEFNIEDIEEARFFNKEGNVVERVTGSVKREVTEEGYIITLKKEGSGFNDEVLNVNLEAIEETKLYSNKENYDADTTSKNKVLIQKEYILDEITGEQIEVTNVKIKGNAKFNNFEVLGEKDDETEFLIEEDKISIDVKGNPDIWFSNSAVVLDGKLTISNPSELQMLTESVVEFGKDFTVLTPDEKYYMSIDKYGKLRAGPIGEEFVVYDKETVKDLLKRVEEISKLSPEKRREEFEKLKEEYPELAEAIEAKVEKFKTKERISKEIDYLIATDNKDRLDEIYTQTQDIEVLEKITRYYLESAKSNGDYSSVKKRAIETLERIPLASPNEIEILTKLRDDLLMEIEASNEILGYKSYPQEQENLLRTIKDTSYLLEQTKSDSIKEMESGHLFDKMMVAIRGPKNTREIEELEKQLSAFTSEYAIKYGEGNRFKYLEDLHYLDPQEIVHNYYDKIKVRELDQNQKIFVSTLENWISSEAMNDLQAEGFLIFPKRETHLGWMKDLPQMMFRSNFYDLVKYGFIIGSPIGGGTGGVKQALQTAITENVQEQIESGRAETIEEALVNIQSFRGITKYEDEAGGFITYEQMNDYLTQNDFIRNWQMWNDGEISETEFLERAGDAARKEGGALTGLSANFFEAAGTESALRKKASLLGEGKLRLSDQTKNMLNPTKKDFWEMMGRSMTNPFFHIGVAGTQAVLSGVASKVGSITLPSGIKIAETPLISTITKVGQSTARTNTAWRQALLTKTISLQKPIIGRLATTTARGSIYIIDHYLGEMLIEEGGGQIMQTMANAFGARENPLVSGAIELISENIYPGGGNMNYNIPTYIY